MSCLGDGRVRDWSSDSLEPRRSRSDSEQLYPWITDNVGDTKRVMLGFSQEPILGHKAYGVSFGSYSSILYGIEVLDGGE